MPHGAPDLSREQVCRPVRGSPWSWREEPHCVGHRAVFAPLQTPLALGRSRRCGEVGNIPSCSFGSGNRVSAVGPRPSSCPPCRAQGLGSSQLDMEGRGAGVGRGHWRPHGCSRWAWRQLVQRPQAGLGPWGPTGESMGLHGQGHLRGRPPAEIYGPWPPPLPPSSRHPRGPSWFQTSSPGEN